MTKKLITLIFIFMLQFSVQAQKHCNIYEVPLTERVNVSSLIVEGIVKNSTCQWDKKRANIYTVHEVEITSVLKGFSTNNLIKIVTKGGSIDLKKHIFSNELELKVGDAGIFLLKQSNFDLNSTEILYSTPSFSQSFIKYYKEDKSAHGPFDHFDSIDELKNTISKERGILFRRVKEIPWEKISNSRVQFENSKLKFRRSTNETQATLASITSFSPTTVQAGRDIQLTITGTGFGATQGTSYVAFKNADDGGSTYIQPFSNQYVSWSDTQIVVKVPSAAGTGTIRVNVGGTNYTSSGTLTVDYAISNFDYTYNSTTAEYSSLLRDHNGLGGYTFKYSSDVITNGKTYFENAAKAWRCDTGVQFLISPTASTVTTVADDNENTVDYSALGTVSGVIAQAITRSSGCVIGSTLNWYVDEIDVEVNSSLSFYYGTGTPGGTQYDYYSTVLHELGHADQLGHVIDTATTPTKIMHYSLGTGVSRRSIDTGASTGGNYWVDQSTATSNCSTSVHKTMNCTSTVTLSTSATSIAENGTSFTVTATQNQLNYSDVVVNLSYSGTATSGTDYTSVASITIPAGSLSASSTITITDDAIYEGSETIIIDVSSVTNGTENGTQQKTVTITDNDTAPTVSLSVDVVSFTEGGSTRTVTATLSTATSLATTVNLAYSGTATYATDYTVSGTGTSITIAAGATTGTVTITNTDDTLYEGTENIIIDVSSVTNATENGTQQVTISLFDNDSAPSVTLSATPTTIAEAAGSTTITATQSAISGVATTITLTISGTAETTDYSQVTTITIPAGSTSGSITCTAVQDTVDEANETVISDITGVTNATEFGTQKVTITITDDDASPTITISSSATSIAENGGGSVTISGTSSVISEQDISINYSLSGTATQLSDYNVSGNYILIPAGSTTSTSNTVINIIDDILDEANETVIVDVSSVTNGTESGTQQKTVTITDDDATPTVTLTASATSISETSGASTITATLSAASGQAITVNLGLTGTATTISDYTLATSITIPAGNTSASITLASVSDVLDEANETVIIDISSVTNATESGTQQQTVTIIDDDATPTVTLTTGTSTIVETSGSTVVTATLSAASGQSVVVNLGLTGTATTTTDYTLTNSITIPAGSTSASITLTSVSDVIDEADETIIIDITSVTNATESGTQQKTVTITDDDATPTVTIAWSNTSIGEGPAGTSNAVATLSAASGQTVTLNLTWSGTATLNTDYTVTSSTITIPAGSTTGFVTMNNMTDTLDEGNSEDIGVTISSATNAIIGNPSQAWMTQNDDDNPPTVTLSAGATSINENAGSTSLTATLSAVSGLTVTVNLTYTGTATSGTDYSNATTITIPAGSTSASITLTAIQDVAIEGNETIIADISSVTNGTENGTQQQTITITDDEVIPTVSLIAGSSSFFEDGSNTITAQLSAAASSNITVNLTYSGTAIFGTDYTVPASITIPSGNTSTFITLSGNEDTIHESTETINVAISSANIATYNNDTTIISLNDNDNPPNITLSTNRTDITEGDGNTATITATASSISGLDVTVELGFVGDALRNSDFTMDNTITIPAGQLSASKTFIVVNDTLDEDNQSATILISNVTNGNELNDEQVTIMIIDNDAPPTITISPNPNNVSENGGTGTFTATLSAVSEKNVTINLSFSTGSATLNTDFTVSGTTITIPAGSTTGSITMSTIDDTLYEGNENAQITISSATNATYGVINEWITILENDTPPTATLSTSTNSISENGGTATITATLSQVSSASTLIMIDYSGTAIFGTDFSQSPEFFISIPAGQLTGSITITAINDTVTNGNLTINAFIADATNASYNSSLQQIITIIDDETPTNTIVNLKLFLEGYYNDTTHEMVPAKFNQGVTTDNDDAADLTVELRNSSNGTLVASTTAVLDVSGLVTAIFSSAYSGSYYIVVKHRNTIETWSATPQIIGSTSIFYDFTTAANKAYGSNQKMLEPGVYGFYSGDINQDDIIDPSDYSDWEIDSDSFAAGYYTTDLNGDGLVDPSDYSIFEINSDNFITANYPIF